MNITPQDQPIIHPGTHMGPVQLRVADLDGQVRYYRDQIGLRVLGQHGDTVSLSAGETPLLRLRHTPGAVHPGKTTGLYHFALLVPDQLEFARILASLYKQGIRHAPTDHTLTMATYLWDPEGNGIEIYVDTPERGRWEFSGENYYAIDAEGNMRSGRDPIDVQALFDRLGAGVDLTPHLPETTTMGHVHLHVDDLHAAERFYTAQLGFELQGMSRGVGMAFVSAGGYHHHIGMNIWNGLGAPVPDPNTTGLDYLSVLLPDEAALQAVLANVDDAEVIDGGYRLQDPAHNGIYLAVG